MCNPFFVLPLPWLSMGFYLVWIGTLVNRHVNRIRSMSTVAFPNPCLIIFELASLLSRNLFAFNLGLQFFGVKGGLVGSYGYNPVGCLFFVSLSEG